MARSRAAENETVRSREIFRIHSSGLSADKNIRIYTLVDGHSRNVAMRFGMNFSIISLMVIWNKFVFCDISKMI